MRIIRQRNQNTPFHNLYFLLMLLISIFVLAVPRARAQDPSSQSVADAARKARDLKNKTPHPHKVITNEDLAPRRPIDRPAPDYHFLETISYAQELPPWPAACDTNPVALRLRSETQSAQSDLDALRRQATLPANIISDRDYDPQYFKPGASGLNVGSAPLLDNQPPIPARVSAVQVEERIANLQQLLRAACESPESAKLQIQLDSAKQELDLAARSLALDEADFYGRADFTSDAAGQLRIRVEQQQMQDLQSEVARLQSEFDAQVARDRNQSR